VPVVWQRGWLIPFVQTQMIAGESSPETHRYCAYGLENRQNGQATCRFQNPLISRSSRGAAQPGRYSASCLLGSRAT